jgi:endonuclease/exonuclease/phosphatase family metal-dependent hydrolase
MVTWNVNNAAKARAARQARWLADQNVDLVCLQEVNASSIDAYAGLARMSWVVRGGDPEGDNRRAVAIAGRLPRTSRATRRLENAPRPEGSLEVEVEVAGQAVQVWSYHAPNGRQNGHAKVEQAHAFARELAAYTAPVVFGADLNTPEVDPLDDPGVVTHWHTGRLRKLRGQPGDDVLCGPTPEHGLRDALRLYLADHPEARAKAVRDRPTGPLAVSHQTTRRSTGEQKPWRFGAIWVSNDWTVRDVQYATADTLASRLSDHAAVLAELQLEPHHRPTS